MPARTTIAVRRRLPQARFELAVAPWLAVPLVFAT
jgi:hypothetical protein